jgi:hypothetical protein
MFYNRQSLHYFPRSESRLFSALNQHFFKYFFSYAALEERFQSVSSSETDLRARWETLSAEHAVATSALRALQEKAGRLEAEQSDFEMRLELAVRKKEAQLADLRGVLEAAYEDIARLEGSGDRETAAAGLQVATKN